MKKTIFAIYTGKGLADPLQAVINKTLPDWRLVSVIDDQIIGEVKLAGSPTQETSDRLISYYKAAEAMGADVILNTCSSVGDVVYEGRKVVNVPIVRIDEAMARKAVATCSTIGVVATLRSTLDPTLRLLQIEADKIGKTITPVDGLADGAFQALIEGKPEVHDQMIADTVMKLAEKVDCILLAQASMARMEKKLNEMVNIPVYSSPQLSLNAIKEEYDK
ncbi:MAG: Asp/Glu/hydantoin racemase [Firmicutes bacterium]|nr:Asp/Glu/hydantoin racemase [Bacillota bacterium]